MMTVLTHQSVQYQGSDVLIINGEKSVFSGNPVQLNAQNLIKNAMKSQYEKKVPFFLRRSLTSRLIKIYITSCRELVFSSHFLDKDNNDRNISYSFYCDDAKNPDKIIRIIADDSIIAGMQPNPADLKILKNYLSFHNNKSKIYSFIGIASCIIVVLMLAII